MERDQIVGNTGQQCRISTHTLTWSVTVFDWLVNAPYGISTHTLTWSVTATGTNYQEASAFQLTRSRGAWHWQNVGWRFIFSFQLTRSRGAWPTYAENYVNLARISTHTLTWSVTFVLNVAGGGSNHFNSHAHVERDIREIWHILKILKFQLTRSRGAWLWCGNSDITTSCISTHTLTWSVTSHWHTLRQFLQISTHTLTWSVTNVQMEKLMRCVFQLTRSRGAWHSVCNTIFNGIDISTHTLTWSVTTACANSSSCLTISTHTLTWSVTR